MLKAQTYSLKGTKLTPITLPKDFEEKENLTLLAQAIRVYEDNLHPGLRKTKTRAEVNRTKKKLYKQKGTGGARHGARSAPIFVGGGQAHGPRPVSRVLSLPGNMAKKALRVALGLKARNKEVFVVDGFSTFKKAKEAQHLMDKLGVGKSTFVLAETNLKVQKVISNVENLSIIPWRNLNAYTVFFGGAIILDKDIFKK